MQQRSLRAALIGLGFIAIILAAGLYLQLPWAMGIWPWVDSSLPYTYLGAFVAGIAASLLWIGLSGELGAAVGGAIDMVIAYTGLAIALFIFSRQTGDPRFVAGAVVCLIGALVSVAMWLWFSRYPIRDSRPLPGMVRASFVAFIVLLAGAGIANLLRIPDTFPWALRPTSSVLVGCTFLGSAGYFLYSLLVPLWRNACAQLWGFLAYDVVLIIPMLLHFGSVKPVLVPALILNSAVLVFSGAVAVYYLLINKATSHRSQAAIPWDASSLIGSEVDRGESSARMHAVNEDDQSR